MALVSVIPARGGSKGIPKKNLAKLGQLTLVERTLKFSSSINLISQTILSSDSIEILQIAKNYDNVILHHRPAYLSDDNSTTDDLLLHLIEVYNLKMSDVILILEPTSPFRSLSSFYNAYSQFQSSDCDTLITVAEDRGAFWVYNDQGKLIRAFNNTSSRRQERKPIFRELGVFYLIKVGAFISRSMISGSQNLYAYEINGIEQIDINTPVDLQIAQQLHNLNEI